MKWKLKLATVLFLTLAIFASGASAATYTEYFVSADVGATGDGTSWANASNDLWGILNNISDDAKGGDSFDIYVAAGEYKSGTLSADSFILSKNVRLWGGFSGNGAGAVSGDRNPKVNVTILSGDHTSYHVVLCSADVNNQPTSLDTRLDGFTITGGKANSGSSPNDQSGGMYNYYASPTIENCTFTGNNATSYGGGMYNTASSPVITNCTFSGNTGDQGGGGMYNGSSSPVITNCTFSGNTGDQGGGMANYNSAPVVVNTIFWGNVAAGGAAIYQSSDGTLTLSNNVIPTGGVQIGSNIINPPDIITGDPKIVSVDVSGAKATAAANVYMYIISSDSGVDDAKTSSAIKKGLPVGTEVKASSGIFVPATDQSGDVRPGNKENNSTNKVDIGAHESPYPAAGGGGGGDPDPDPDPIDPPAPNPTDPVTDTDVNGPFEDGKTDGETGIVDKPGTLPIINESEELKTLFHAGEVQRYRVPILSTTAGGKTTDRLNANPTQAAGLMTGLLAALGNGTLPTSLNGRITPVMSQLKGTATAARFDIYFPNAQRTALMAAGSLFEMSFTVEGVNQKGDSSVYVAKTRENLVRTTKAVKETNSKFKIKVSNNPNATDAMKFSDFAGTEFHIKLITTVKAEALKNIQDANYVLNDLHNALLNNVKDANWAKYKTEIDKLPTAQKDNETELQRVIDRVNASILVTGVSLNKSSLPLKVTESETLIATVAPTNAGNKLVKWSTSEAKFATVDTGGKVTAVANGTATITAMTDDGSYTAKCVVEVTGGSDPKKGGGGGCNAVAPFFAFALIPLLLVRKRK